MKICYIENVDFGFFHFRPALVKELINQGHDVHLICPRGNNTDTLVTWGIKHHHVGMAPNSMNILKDRQYAVQIKDILLKIQPDVVHTYSVKPNVYVPKLAKELGVKRVICSVIGLGSLFTWDTFLVRNLLRPQVIRMYRKSFKYADKVIFINHDDRDLFVDKKVVDPEKAELIISEGLDLDYFSPESVDKEIVKKFEQELSIDHNTPMVLFASRMLWSKGVKELIEACRILKKDGVKFRCIFAGRIDEKNRDGVPGAYIESTENEGLVEYVGVINDMRELLYSVDVVVLPSYREGVPRILMEAAAIGKPLIATNVPGCREVVENEKNGFLVPPKDIESLKQAMHILISDETKRIEHGKNSLVMSKQKFDQKVINGRILESYDLL
ncbi:glycosyltransferase family 4 protein [Mesotoga prima]|uniref:glycosyltransferase family 4 protein n=1 Tax=Mesotoga prima TaxID=1184387 RepID=UPI002FE075B8